MTVPERAAELLLAATVTPKVTGLAVPPPNEIVIHGTSAIAVFVQPIGEPFAEKVRLSPAALAEAEMGLKVTEVQVCPNTTGERHTKRAANSARRGIRTLKHCSGGEVSLVWIMGRDVGLASEAGV